MNSGRLLSYGSAKDAALFDLLSDLQQCERPSADFLGRGVGLPRAAKTRRGFRIGCLSSRFAISSVSSGPLRMRRLQHHVERADCTNS
jgi:hypothetical protein